MKDILKRGSRGFTLIELLAVIVIIGILVGIVIGVGGNVRQKAATARAKAEIAALELSLERYKIDNGDYPNWPGISDSGGLYTGQPNNYSSSLINTGAAVGQQSLFEQLVGRPNYTANSTGTQYFEVKESQTAQTSAGAGYFVDPFGYAYGYKYDDTAAGTAADPKSLFNQVVPDMWSTAGQSQDSSLDESSNLHYIYLRWVTNWGSR